MASNDFSVLSGSMYVTGSVTASGGFLSEGTELVSGSSQIDHNLTTNYTSSRHIDHSSVSITGANGVAGGGTIASSRQLTLDTGSAEFTGGVKTKLNTEAVVSGSTINLTSAANKLRFYYASEGTLPAVATYSGMFAFAGDTSKGYYSNGTAWVPLATSASVGANVAAISGLDTRLTVLEGSDFIYNLNINDRNGNLGPVPDGSTITFSGTGNEIDVTYDPVGFNVSFGLPTTIYTTASQAVYATLAGGTATATSASYALTASYAENAVVPTTVDTASYVDWDSIDNKPTFPDEDVNTANLATRLSELTGSVTIGSGLVVTGDLTVSGTTTTINATTLEVADKNIYIASGSADATAADGAGITIAGADATLTYGSTADAFSFNKSLNVGGSLNVTGDICAYATSDERLKTNIITLDNPLERLSYLKGVEYDWNELSGKEGHEVGIIAQDLQKALPAAVVERDNGYLAVQYERVVALLIEAVKDQQRQIDELKAKLS